MSGNGPVIEVSGVSKSYPMGFWRKRVKVLSDLSFVVGQNEIVGFLGPNGAGKTTTIKILNRLAFPDTGTVTIFGEEAGKRPGSRRRIGFMPEQPYFYEYLTGAEFMSLCGHMNGLGRGEIKRRSEEMLTRVGLDGAAGLAIRKYSKGMLQRLGLAQALLHDPELVILDEPMSGLDPMGRMEVRNLIRELKDAGKTVFFSSHIISDVEALCDRVVMIHKGTKVAEGSVDELMGKEGVQYVEVVFSPLPPPGWASAAGLTRESGSVQGDTFVLKARDHEDANHWIGELRRVGSLVTSCIPVKKRLEEIYVEQVAGNAREDGLGG
ncbi:MAG: ABC transporter ATP-binding protein [Deltaproteobacteria bacterium]|nr:ABC transporter ATP-binding protein [Deltaproteobacteria bacterium]